MAEQRAVYGGQAVVEGVLIRGRRCLSLAVRLGNGGLHTEMLPFNPDWARGWRRFPIMRGALVLWETLSLGLRALNRSSELALLHAEGDKKVADEGFGKGAIALTIAVALVIGIGFFFLLPHFAIRSLDSHISSSVLSNFLEGVLRMALLLGYLAGIGRLKDVQRLFQYHGAEHMAIHAHEHGDPLEPGHVARYPTAHPRCGTAFLLLVAVVSVIVFSFLGRPDLWLSILFRIALIPVVAGISYELLRLGGRNVQRGWTRPIVLPGLALQRLTTRQPDSAQLEVAIAALSLAVQADQQPHAGRPEAAERG